MMAAMATAVVVVVARSVGEVGGKVGEVWLVARSSVAWLVAVFFA